MYLFHKPCMYIDYQDFIDILKACCFKKVVLLEPNDAQNDRNSVHIGIEVQLKRRIICIVGYAYNMTWLLGFMHALHQCALHGVYYIYFVPLKEGVHWQSPTP